jgi:cyanophycinase-like exopeptidase
MIKNGIGTITLMGSGEMADSMSRVHRRILSNIDGDVSAVFLDTPAGFELNADEISARAVEYFAQRFAVTLDVASFKNKTRASAAEIATAMGQVRRANFIFAGPGSPSYAVRNWDGAEVWNTAVNRWLEGAHLVFASAAAITTGAWALPVYEIYKAGEEAHWIAGLNLLGRVGLNLAVVPHWNNAEGGTFDTRFCYMGAPRLEALESQLPHDTVILGVDEYTACILDPDAQQGEVMGAGNVTVRHGGREWSYPAGATFGFEQLRAANPAPGAAAGMTPTPEPEPQALAVEPDGAASKATTYLHQLAHALSETRESERQRDLIEQAHDAMHELSAEWMEADHTAIQADISPFVQTLIELRTKLRAAKQYALADEVRLRLAQFGILLEDTPTGTRWKKAEP